MELIERYLYQVGRYLPLKQREDILTELRSYILDALDVSEGVEADEAQVVALLKQMGPPQKAAASYHSGMNYLIGPELFPLFRLVVSIVLIVVLGALILAMAVGAIFDSGSLSLSTPQGILETLAGLWNALISAFGMTVFVFAVLQYFGVHMQEEEKWDPRQLPPITQEGEQVSRAGTAVEIAVNVLLLVLLGIFVDKGGVLAHMNGVAITDEVIQTYAPLIGLVLVVSLLFYAYVSRQARWSPPMRFIKVLVSLLSIATLYALIQGHVAWLNAHGGSSFLTTLESLELLPQNAIAITQNVTMQGFRLGFTIALVVEGIETVVEVVRLVQYKLTPSGGVPYTQVEG